MQLMIHRFHHVYLELEQQATLSEDENTSIRVLPPCRFCKHDNRMFSGDGDGENLNNMHRTYLSDKGRVQV
eukprot:scaffold10399_cov113-Cylindrotheca_fusiformis.AAC.6